MLKDRLVRRGLASTVGSLGALSALDEARAALPEHLAASTARAAVRVTMGGVADQATSASALTLMSEVLRAAIAAKLKAAVAVLLTLAVAGTAAAHFVAGAREQTLPADSWWGQTPDASSVTGPPRPADEIVKEIETQLKIAHGPQAQTNFVAFHAQVADLVSELRSAYPDDPRVTLYLPERWESLTFLNRRADIFGEIKRVVLVRQKIPS